MDHLSRGKPIRSVFVDGAKIRLFAEAFGISIRELARRAGCSHTYLIRVLDGKRHISTKYIVQLVAVLEETARTRRLDSSTFFREAPSAPAIPAVTPEHSTTPLPSRGEFVGV